LPIEPRRPPSSSVNSPGRYLGFLGIYDLMFALVCWAAFEYVVIE